MSVEQCFVVLEKTWHDTFCLMGKDGGAELREVIDTLKKKLDYIEPLDDTQGDG